MKIKMEKTEDRRVRKTKKAMSAALAALLQKKPLKSITVREISELADINRGTFYLHYSDVFDMVEKLQNDIFEKFNKIISEYEPKKNIDTLFPVLVKTFELLAENAELAKCLIGKNGDAAFVDKLKNVLKEKCFSEVNKILKTDDEAKFSYFFQFIVSGCIGIFSTWLNNGMPESPSEMARLTEDFIVKGIYVLETDSK